MPNSHEFIVDVNRLLEELEQSGELTAGIAIANKIIKLLGSSETTQPDLVVDEHVLQLPNAERYDHWFQSHPWMGGERAAFEITDANDMPIQAKLYWLKKRSRQFIAGGVHFTENWEDADYTHNENFKIGIDFFLSPNGKSLLVALSNRGNIRIVELQHKLNNTQVEIFSKWRDASQISSREALHNTLWESFKLQTVNKEFYTGVSNSFTELLQHLKSIGRDEEDAKLFASRLLGRLLFVWFLRKKSIIDESLGYFDALTADATTYYKQSLERLFFNTLNTPIDDRDEFNTETQKRLFPEVDSQPQAKLFQVDSRTPYLNGGLFEAHSNDWYKDASLTLPEGFFTNLYDHFDQFNFTTDESSPEYEQVAIDPEMLGRVFESLLATQVDETGQQARKAKGAFYTPREIVSYMCRESLRNYLYGKHNDDERYKKSVDELLDRSDHEWAGAGTNSRRDAVPKEYRTDIVEALDTVTILDPACGSGAFPMGMLQLLIKTYERLEGRFDAYKTKLQIVQNNIFGVDIEPMAVEISRLRAWLSLIVDEEESHDVAPLPNLDFKFVCANSLIPLDDSKADLFNDPELHKQLADIRQTYFNARKPHTKKAAQEKYYKLAGSNIGLFDNLRTKQLKSFDPFINSHPADFFNADQMFGIEDGFNIVIGNPPYIQIKKLSYKPQLKALGFDTFNSSGDLYVLFYEIANSLLSKEHGVGAYITSNKWMRTNYGQSLRSYLIRETTNKRLIDFNSYKVFDTATVDTNILIWDRSKKQDGNVTVSLVGSDYRSTDDLSKYARNSEALAVYEEANPWLILSSEQSSLIKKIQEHTLTLSDYEVSLHYGMLTGANKTFLLNESEKQKLIALDPKNTEVIKPILRGEDIRRYGFVFKNQYLLCLHNGVKAKGIHPVHVTNDYPTLLSYLESFGDDFKKRGEQGDNWWNLRNCAYLDKFEQKKIIYSDIVQDVGRFYLDTNNFYTNDTAFIISGKNLELLTGVLNSKAFSYFYKFFFSGGVLGSSGVRYKKDFLQAVPLPAFTESQKNQIEELVEELLNIHDSNRKSDTLELEERIDRIVYEAYSLADEDIELIENSSHK